MKKLKLFLLSILLILGSKTFAQLSSGDLFMDIWTRSEYEIILAAHNSNDAYEWPGTLIMLLEPIVGGFNTAFEIYGPDGYKKFYGRLTNTKKMMTEGKREIKVSNLELNGNRRGHAISNDLENGCKVLILQVGNDDYSFIYK